MTFDELERGSVSVTFDVDAESVWLAEDPVTRASESALKALAADLIAIADHEGFPAHAAAVRARVDPAAAAADSPLLSPSAEEHRPCPR